MSDSRKSKKLFIIAGENSGDLHASNLVRQLTRRNPDLRFYGLGGNQMKQAGVQLLSNTVDRLAIIGVAEVFMSLERIWRLYRRTCAFLTAEKPDAVILIDYPGFNLRIARFAKERLGLTVIYYICPQIWAWGRGRLNNIVRHVDKMLVTLPFEEAIYKEAGMDVTYVGHPLLDVMRLTMTKEQVFAHFKFDPTKKLIGLLPGSRRPEIERLLPAMLEAAEMIHENMPGVQFVLPRASTIKRDLIESYLRDCKVEVKIVDQYRYNVRSAMDFAIVASGTATLETALLNCPMIIIYKTSFISWLIAKSFVNVPYVGLANIVAGDRIVPELLQNEVSGQNIADKLLQILNSPQLLQQMKLELSRVKDKIGGPGASQRAAQCVLDTIERKEKDKQDGAITKDTADHKIIP